MTDRTVHPTGPGLPAAALLAALAFAAAVHAGDRLVLLDGRTVTGQAVTAIDSTTVTCGQRRFELMELRSIQRDADQPAGPTRLSPPSVLLLLRDGGQVLADQVLIDQQQCRIDWAWGKGWTIGLEQVRAVVFDVPAEVPAGLKSECRQALARQANEDVLLVHKDDQTLLAVGGALVEVDRQQVGLMYRQQQRRVGRDKVYAIVLGGATGRPDLTGQVLAHLSDGSRLWGRVDRLAGGRLTLRDGAGRAISLPWSAVRRLEVRSDRMVWLSQLEPVEVDDRPLFVLGGWERDRSWLGRPIRLGGKVYPRGLGVHAPCRLVYEPAGRFDQFAAVIGIDDETHRQHGDCLFKVIGDGRTLFQQRQTCHDPPRPVRLDISGVRRLELVVEYGQDLDLGDHADWADARLIRNPRPASSSP